MKIIFFIFCLTITIVDCFGQGKDTFEVYFSFNAAQIAQGAETHIDQLIFNDTLIHGDKLIVLGYTDYVGSNSYNDSLSKLRAKNVRDYLIRSGFDKKDITLCIGKGKISRSMIQGKDGYAADRKVQIIIDRSVPAITPAVSQAKPPDALPAKDEVKSESKINIDQLSVNQAFTLNHIYFAGGLPDLLPGSLPDLKKLNEFMHENPRVTIRIEGHVCCQGPIEGSDTYYNDGYLSEYRAKAIYKYLVDNGINGNRMKCVGLGNLNPVVRNEVTEEDKVKNRRVEIRILSK